MSRRGQLTELCARPAPNCSCPYTDGKPVQRREIITKHATTLEELRIQAKASPQLHKAIASLLDENP